MDIFIYENNSNFYQQLSSLLSQSWSIAHISSPEHWSTMPQLVLVGLSTRDQDALLLIKRIRAAYSNVPILSYALRANPLYGKYAMEAGADGFICDHFHLIEQKVHEMLKGVNPIPQEVIKIYTKARSNPHENLSEREVEILSFLAAGLRNTDIAERLQLSPKTISTYKSRLMKKLDLQSDEDLKCFIENHAFL